MLNKHYAGFAHHTFHHESHVGLRSSFVFFSILMTGSHSVSRHSGPDSDQTRSRLGAGAVACKLVTCQVSTPSCNYHHPSLPLFSRPNILTKESRKYLIILTHVCFLSHFLLTYSRDLKEVDISGEKFICFQFPVFLVVATI